MSSCKINSAPEDEEEKPSSRILNKFAAGRMKKSWKIMERLVENISLRRSLCLSGAKERVDTKPEEHYYHRFPSLEQRGRT